MYPTNENVRPSSDASADGSAPTMVFAVAPGSTRTLDLRELGRFVRGHLIAIVVATLVFGAAATAYAFLKKPQYEAKVVLAPVGDESSQMSLGGLGQLGGLASLAGIQLGGSAGKSERIALLKSRGLTEDFIT